MAEKKNRKALSFNYLTSTSNDGTAREIFFCHLGPSWSLFSVISISFFSFFFAAPPFKTLYSKSSFGGPFPAVCFHIVNCAGNAYPFPAFLFTTLAPTTGSRGPRNRAHVLNRPE